MSLRRATILCSVLVWVLLAQVARAQDLVPGAYIPVPVGFNILTIVGSGSKGDITFDPSLPVEDARATIRGVGVGVARTFGLAGRYANVGVVAPYLYGDLEGLVAGGFQQRTLSGMGDLTPRFAVNLYGAPAKTRQQFASFRPSTLVGVSIVVSVPLGEYDPSRVINIGTNRWAFKPEIGLSHRRGRWTVEGDVAGIFFTDNSNFSNGGTREQAPIAAFQGHLIYTIRPGLWVAGDGNFWRGGRITTNGVPAALDQRNSRIGATLAVPVGRHQMRIAYSAGAYTRLGGDFSSLGVSYSYAWTRRQ